MEGELPGPASSPFTVCQTLAALVYLRGSGSRGAMGCLSSKRRSWAALSVGGPAPSDGETEGRSHGPKRCESVEWLCECVCLGVVQLVVWPTVELGQEEPEAAGTAP